MKWYNWEINFLLWYKKYFKCKVYREKKCKAQTVRFNMGGLRLNLKIKKQNGGNSRKKKSQISKAVVFSH
jgi:hypothetical protein